MKNKEQQKKVLQDSSQQISRLLRAYLTANARAEVRGHLLGIGVGRPRRGILTEKIAFNHEKRQFEASLKG